MMVLGGLFIKLNNPNWLKMGFLIFFVLLMVPFVTHATLMCH